jgi:transposase-like protein/IS1 family transposase
MEARPDIDSLCCINKKCKYFQKPEPGRLYVRKTYGCDNIRYLRCTHCSKEFSERRGSALFNTKISENRAFNVIDHIRQGCGFRATVSLTGVSKEAVSRLMLVTGESSERLHDKKVRKIRAVALEFDEKWSYVGKKQRHLAPFDDPDELGDRWDAVAIETVTKLVLAQVSGKRNEHTIGAMVEQTAWRIERMGKLPAIFTDGERCYKRLILKAFGAVYYKERGKLPYYKVPHDLVYAQVIKHRQNGKVTAVETRPIWGKTKLSTVLEKLGWNKVNTSAIERFNLTDRTCNSRKMRKTLRFSKRHWYHDAMSWINLVWYNFHNVHRSLGKTPAMAAGIALAPFSTTQLLRLNTQALR